MNEEKVHQTAKFKSEGCCCGGSNTWCKFFFSVTNNSSKRSYESTPQHKVDELKEPITPK